MKNVLEILQSIIANVLSGGRRTTAEKVRTVLDEMAISYSNFKTGGNSFETEVGYNDAYRPTNKNAFASVDMVKGNSIDIPITEQYWKTNIPNPIDGEYHIIKVTMGADSQPQYEDLGPI